MRYLLLCLATILFASEPSAFEAGDLNTPNPYGLTKDEQYILQNKKAIQRLQKELFSLKQKEANVEERVAGLQSIVEGIDTELQKLKKNGKVAELQSQIDTLKTDLNSSIVAQQKNFKQIKKVLKEMGEIIDSISSQYVSKEEFTKAIEELRAEIEKGKIARKSGKELFYEAKKAYRAKRYKKAKKLFEGAISKHYKPATSNFYIGESCYYQRDYNCAIKHYKRSASIAQNTSFMPTLLLHTAISLERVGKKREARKFYRTLIKLYPKTKAAKIATKKLK